MAAHDDSPAPLAPAGPAPYPMATPGYGKRDAPDQHPSSPTDFALLPARERYIAGFIERLPEGASMSVKSLAKQLPLYGQQAIASALKALSVAGHLRRVRCVVSTGGEVRWVFRTYWSRTARDNEWWAGQVATTTPEAVPEAVPVAVPEDAYAPESAPVREAEAVAVPAPRRPIAPPAPQEPPVSPAYQALTQLGRLDARLPLSADDCAYLAPLAAQWLARGVSTEYLVQALTAGLPASVGSPRGFTRDRLLKKIPPAPPSEPSPADVATATATEYAMLECTSCRVPGPADALPDGLCRPCREPEAPETVSGAEGERDVHALVDGLRGMLRNR
ncbi:MarR family transcriptional regulator [Streptomyces sp. NPDC057682]|uniref:MarR family transcriptional regulator n=1 Tax=Streptomyces sp. NPDC057682 TaxID=3346210 RepID=UPI0036AF62E9